jgi:hypothetical protein
MALVKEGPLAETSPNVQQHLSAEARIASAQMPPGHDKKRAGIQDDQCNAGRQDGIFDIQ